MAYNRDQWVDTFEDAILKLRPHMTRRVLDSVANMAWHKYGVAGLDPKEAAAQWSATMNAT